MAVLAGSAIALGLLGGCAGTSATPTPTRVPEGQLLDYTPLSEGETPAGGVKAEILVKNGAAREEVFTLLRFVRDVAWPEGWLEVKVFDSQDAWTAHHRCLLAIDNYGDKLAQGDPPECIESEDQFGNPEFVALLSRNPSTDFDEISWLGSEN